MEHPIVLNPERILAHGRDLRVLARRLVRDEHRAADAVQETLLRALERGFEERVPLQLWLNTVLRNLVRDDRRQARRRVEREHTVAAQSSHSDACFRAHRELVAIVDRLAEPYREAILLRYFEELPPRRIAAHLGVPVKTVKARLHRGLGLLREELERRHGGKEAWLEAFAPFALVPSGWFSGAAVASLAGASLLVGAGALALAPRGTVPSPAGAPGSTLLTPRSTEPARTPLSSTAHTQREAALSAPASVTRGGRPPLAHADLSSRTGRVLDANGFGLGDVRVGYREGIDVLPVSSDADGGFVLPVLEEAIVSRDARYATVLASVRPSEGSEEERIVVVAPSVRLAGTVRDPVGKPLAGVGVHLRIPMSFRGRFREILDGSREEEWNATTDAEGRFELPAVPALDAAEVAAWSGHAHGRGVRVPDHDELALELVLDRGEFRPGADALHVVGEVRHADGALAPGARVLFGDVSTVSDAYGLFELYAPAGSASTSFSISDGQTIQFGSGPTEPRTLIAVHAGEQPATQTPGRDSEGRECFARFVRLWLGEPALSLEGIVFGTDGRPLVDALVWIEDLSFAAKSLEGFWTLEHLMAGKTDGWQDRWFVARTDEGGRFRLTGLAARDYRLAALDPATLQVVHAGPFAAGTDSAELVFDPRDLWRRVEGRVVDLRGAPLEGLAAHLERVSFAVEARGNRWFGREELPPVLTDTEGRFSFERVPRAGIVLRVDGLPPAKVELASVADPLDVRVVQPWLGHVQIEVDAFPARGKLVILDASEAALEFFVVGGGNLWHLWDLDLGDPTKIADGQTPVLRVPGEARWVVLRDSQGQELRRESFEVAEGLVQVRL
jgi:RNA polymerase sigma-70 factor (ECF subfamily)